MAPTDSIPAVGTVFLSRNYRDLRVEVLGTVCGWCRSTDTVAALDVLLGEWSPIEGVGCRTCGATSGALR